MGAALADSKPFNQIGADQIITPPLWGVADSAPYLHDGRAATLNDAILQHAGDGTGPLSTGQNRICVSEIADATNSNFEFVEIFVE